MYLFLFIFFVYLMWLGGGSLMIRNTGLWYLLIPVFCFCLDLLFQLFLGLLTELLLVWYFIIIILAVVNSPLISLSFQSCIFSILIESRCEAIMRSIFRLILEGIFSRVLSFFIFGTMS